MVPFLIVVLLGCCRLFQLYSDKIFKSFHIASKKESEEREKNSEEREKESKGEKGMKRREGDGWERMEQNRRKKCFSFHPGSVSVPCFFFPLHFSATPLFRYNFVLLFLALFNLTLYYNNKRNAVFL